MNTKTGHTPEITANVYTVLGMAERSLEWYSNDGTRQHHSEVLEKTRRLIEYAPELLAIAKKYLFTIETELEDLKDRDENVGGFDYNLGEDIAFAEKQIKKVSTIIAKAEGLTRE